MQQHAWRRPKLVTRRSCLQHPRAVQVPPHCRPHVHLISFCCCVSFVSWHLIHIYPLKRLRSCGRRLRPWPSAFRLRQGHVPEFGGSKLPAVLAEGRTRCLLCRPGRQSEGQHSPAHCSSSRCSRLPAHAAQRVFEPVPCKAHRRLHRATRRCSCWPACVLQVRKAFFCAPKVLALTLP